MPSSHGRTLEEALCRECMAQSKPTQGRMVFSRDFRALGFAIVAIDKAAVRIFYTCWVHGLLEGPGIMCICGSKRNQDPCRRTV